MQNKSKIDVQNSGQVKTTIPKAIAGAMKLKKGDDIEWIFDRGDLIVRKV